MDYNVLFGWWEPFSGIYLLIAFILIIIGIAKAFSKGRGETESGSAPSWPSSPTSYSDTRGYSPSDIGGRSGDLADTLTERSRKQRGKIDLNVDQRIKDLENERARLLSLEKDEENYKKYAQHLQNDLKIIKDKLDIYRKNLNEHNKIRRTYG